MTKQIGLSPKVLADLVASVIAFLVLAAALGLDPVLAAALSKFVGTLGGIWVGPGAVVTIDPAKSRTLRESSAPQLRSTRKP